MGGFTIEFCDDDDENADNMDKRILNFFPAELFVNEPRRILTLTPAGMEVLKKSGNSNLLPKISENLIKDRSKGSALAKTLVCLQGNFSFL